LYNAPR
jgi:cAMP-dependent protein kinase regulator